jgi:alkanesulfonate monooxygenase SsuD/methylene tetrahydromethanopterin reductase-like flavin-dependent oxidoreductase (luciferase family)
MKPGKATSRAPDWRLRSSETRFERSARMLQLGLFLPVMEGWLGDRWLPRWPEVARIAELAESVGFDALFVPDHLVIGHSPYWGIPEGETRGTWEAWTLVSALAARTRRVAIGTFVLGAGFRNPALLAKMAATADEVSEGRLILGLGCGSHPPEYAAFGYPYDHRVDRFEEALQILVPLLREGRVDFAGRYHAAHACELLPRGLRPAGPPIWIAAYQPRMIRLAARWGEAFVTAWHPDAGAVAEPLARIDAACVDVGRPAASLDRVVGVIVRPGTEPRPPLPVGTIGGSPEEIASRLLGFHAAGVGHVVCMLDPRDATGLERFAPVIELVRRAER